MVVCYCTADALKRHERVNAFNLVLEILLDDVHPVIPWVPWPSLETYQLPLNSLTSYSGVLHSQDVTEPSQSFLYYTF